MPKTQPAAKKLTPSQKSAVESLSAGMEHSPIQMCWTEPGMGKTTILEELHRRHGGRLLRLGSFVEHMRTRDPASIEENFLAWIVGASRKQKHLYVDDLQMLDGIFCCNHFYQRRGWLTASLNALKERTALEGWTLTATGGGVPDAWKGEVWTYGFKEPSQADYGVWLSAFLGDAVANIDVAKIFRFAPHLNAYQFRNASWYLRREKRISAEQLIDTLRTRHISSNVDLGEVQPVSLSSLRGLESESNAAVCVMLTAMNVGSLPPALVRSGRIELWLTTTLPDAAARLAILRDRAETAAEPIKSAELELLVEPSEGLTGADLKRVVDDAKLLYAYDKLRKHPERAAADYLLEAIKTVREQRASHARAQRELNVAPKMGAVRSFQMFMPTDAD